MRLADIATANNNAEDKEEEKEVTTTVDLSLRLPNRLYKAAQAISILLGYDNFEDYICEVIKADVRCEIDSCGSLEMMVAEDGRERILAEIESSE